jgi:putative peptidoglycan lipid II flippase
VDEKSRITKAAGVMSVATFISRILGFVKDMILAQFFGATGSADTFFVAFRIPNLLRELFAEGSMSSALIPVLTEYQTKHGKEEARRLVRITFTFILIVVGCVCLAGIVFSPAIVSAIAPGFLKSPEKFSLAVLLTRVMFPFLLFISLASLVMGALNIRRIFFIPALAPAMLNIIIILIVLAFSSGIEQPIITVAVAVAVGGFFQFAFQLPSFIRNGYSLKPQYGFSHPGLKKMSLLLVPATMGMAVAQINIFVSTILASYLPEGSITYLYYSMRLIQFPVGVFGVAMGMAVLPTLSEHAVKGEYEKLRENFSFALRLLFFITIPAMAGLIAIREPIVNVLFQRGKFDYAATVGTANALLYYSLGIWCVVGSKVMTSTFYSLQDTKTPVKIAVTALFANVLLSVILMNPLKHGGLALANSVASGLNFALMFIFLRKKLQRIDGKRILRSFLITVIASTVMGFLGGMLLRGELWNNQGNLIYKVLSMSGTIAVCAAVYFFLSFMMKSDEARYVLNTVRRKLKVVV